jgi:hypothetical protein
VCPQTLLLISFSIGLLLAPLSKMARQGNALFQGKVKLAGRIRGHDDLLPPAAVRCTNCHNAYRQATLSRVAPPHLNRSLLLDARQRRGGPPSRYDQAAFCRLLKSGADPAYVLISREMPVYEVNDEQCASLWAFLLEQGSTK